MEMCDYVQLVFLNEGDSVLKVAENDADIEMPQASRLAVGVLLMKIF